MDEYKNYADVKIYYDGSHYIGIPKENYPHGKGSKRRGKTVAKQTKTKAKFDIAYRESQSLPKRERKKYIAEQMKAEFSDDTECKSFVERNFGAQEN